jgi:uncharacterized protein (DUF2336 family)
LHLWGEQLPSVRSLLDEVEAAFRRGTSDSRATALRNITDLFLVGADSFQKEHIGVFDDVLCELVDKIERMAIAELSEKIAPISKAPPRLTRRLSWDDDIAIAGPMLRESPVLDDNDLFEIAQKKSQLHLEAIAARPHLSERVADVLIERGHSPALTAVAENHGARFSTGGYDNIVGKAERDVDIAAALLSRPDLTPELFRKLVAQATATVQQKLMARVDQAMKERLQSVLQSISQEIARGGARNIETYVSASKRPITALDKGRLRSQLTYYATRGRAVECAIAIAAIAELPTDTIKHLMVKSDLDALLVVCKACSLGWGTARALLELAAESRGNSDVNSAAYLDQYTRISREIAERVIRFLKARKSVSETELRTMLAS